MSFQTTPQTSDAVKPVIQAEMPSTEKVVEQPKAEPIKEDSRFSERASLMIQKEKRILREKQETKAMRETIAKREAEIQRQEQAITQFEQLKKTHPLKALELLGLNYNDLTQTVLNAENPTPEYQIKSVQDQLAEFKKAQEDQSKLAAEQAKAQAESELNEVLDQFKGEISSFVTSKTDDYEFINLFDQTNLVYDTIQEYYNTNKQLLTIKQSCDLVEKYLEDQMKKTTETKKFQKLYNPQQPQSKPSATISSQNMTQQRPQAQSKTLTNNMVSSSIPSSLPAKTESERLARAMAALDGNR